MEVADLLLADTRLANQAVRPNVHRAAIDFEEVIGACLIRVEHTEDTIGDIGNCYGVLESLQPDAYLAGKGSDGARAWKEREGQFVLIKQTKVSGMGSGIKGEHRIGHRYGMGKG